VKICAHVQAFQFTGSKSLTINKLNHIDSPRNHISIDSCKETSIFNLHITAPENSVNTDGIDITSSSNIIIKDLSIGTDEYFYDKKKR